MYVGRYDVCVYTAIIGYVYGTFEVKIADSSSQGHEVRLRGVLLRLMANPVILAELSRDKMGT